MSALPEIVQQPLAYVEPFLDYLTSRNCSPLTVKAYRADLASLASFTSTGHLSVHDADRYVTSLCESGLSSSSVHRRAAACRSFYDYLLRYGVVERNPFHGVTLPKREQRLPVCPDAAAVQACLDKIEETVLGLRDKALIAFLFGSGSRIAEALSLTVGDAATLDKGEMRVIGKGNKERVLVISPHAVEAIRSYLAASRELLAGDTDALFVTVRGTALTYDTALDIVQKRFAAMGLEITPHSLRHGYGSLLSDKGVDLRVVQQLMGHSDPRTTSRYLHTGVSRLHAAVNAAFHD